MMFEWKNQSQTGTYASINSHKHMNCVLILAYKSLDQLHPTPEYTPAPQYMDLSDIFNFPDLMTTASNEDILSLDDVFGL